MRLKWWECEFIFSCSRAQHSLAFNYGTSSIFFIIIFLLTSQVLLKFALRPIIAFSILHHMRYCYTVVITPQLARSIKKILDEKTEWKKKTRKNNLLPSSAKVWCSMSVVVDEKKSRGGFKKLKFDWKTITSIYIPVIALAEERKKRGRGKIIFNRSNFFRHVVAPEVPFWVWKIVIHFTRKK